MKKSIVFILALTLLAISLAAQGVSEQTTPQVKYPEKTIQIIVNRGPGGGTDTTARMISAELEKVLGTSVVVLNQEGGDGVIGMNAAASAKPDGYSLTVTANNELANMLVNAKGITFSKESFDYICSVNIRGYIFTVQKNSNFKSFDELLAYAKANPKKLTLGIPGGGLEEAALSFMRELGAEFTIVNAGNGGTLSTYLLGSHVDTALIGAQFFKNLTDGGCKVFLQTVEKRDYGVPTVPTVVEMGYPGIIRDTRIILAAPAGTPKEILEILTSAMDKVFVEGLSQRLIQGGETPLYLKGADLEIYLNKYFDEIIPILNRIKASKS